MLTGSPAARAAAADVVADLRVGGKAAWNLDRRAVADRLDELILQPRRLRQGQLNLCGPAALLSVWLGRDPLAVARYALDLYRYGWARLGDQTIAASRSLRATAYADLEARTNCPAADWMLLSALRDSANRVLRYDRFRGFGETAAALTTPAAMRRWLSAWPAVAEVADSTRLLRLPRQRGPRPQLVPAPGPDREVFLLVRQAMFAPLAPAPHGWRRARDEVTRRLPDHWVVLVDPLASGDGGAVTMRCWTWGGVREIRLTPDAFGHSYFGALSVTFGGPRAPQG